MRWRTGMRAAGLEDAEEAVEIGGDVFAREVERIANARLRRQMHDAVGAEVGKQRAQAVVVGDVELGEGEPLVLGRLCEPGPLEAHVIVGVEIVEAVHRHAGREQARGQVKADEACGTGDEYPLRLGGRLSHVDALSRTGCLARRRRKALWWKRVRRVPLILQASSPSYKLYR